MVREIAARRAAIAAFNDVPASEVPADAVTASASGLDPDISPAYAQLQVARVARARGLSGDAVEKLLTAHTSGGGYLSQTIVNVVELNLALDRQEG
nr:potassium-transporting ATPase subunit C [Tessaracoccus coleopterorum]